ncbi:MAG: hypothetical protein A2Y98_03155 [Candidatus Portnoybacteria bacterium RBG_19FT_COMBO_36_7]|uniref:Glycosyltransferase RgtA/B/C/D-like domain-containing protein n=1 Tax=Candidatus Portnoybacteria bacterium RBG_19FT_COMBO_36_7 TaxID=1801992 RepID=A0A1G2F8I7_9BACT|nr:MAG: hypothetical protein A2Y98_03155 [Candidatus Portnoybacteria bacterium RBG_19FT_COMBO_36_7]
MKESTTRLIAAALIIFMVVVALWSLTADTAIMDEVAHLPAGYSYVTQQDMRLNPEHPPLIKDLSGLAVLAFSKILEWPINFPSDIKAWTQDINGQWDFGFNFMYREGNPASLMLFFGRLPMVLILVILGIYIFRWTKELWGKQAALLSLFLYSFSPTFIAHGRFVTTDVAAAAAFFIATFYFVRWIKNPKSWNFITATLFFGIAQLTKFSLFLIIPLFVFLAAVWIIVKIINKKQEKEPSSFLKIITRYALGTVFIFILGYALVVTPVYYFHVKNYPSQKQQQDMEFILTSYAKGPDKTPFASCTQLSRITRCPAELTIWSADKSLPLRAFGQYMLGLLMVFQRAAGGNTTYFLGEVSAAGWSYYFPVVYLLKEPLTMHILTIMALIILFYYMLKKRPTETFGYLPEKSLSKLEKISLWLTRNFESFAMISFIALYWIMSIRSTLNIGVRHVLPTFPFVYGLISSQIIYWIRPKINSPKILSFLKYELIIILLAFQAISVILVFPSFLAYFNELAGGPKNGYKYAADSNLDWGQDLARLNLWLEENNINKIYIQYFGGTDAQYVLGNKFQPWWGDRNPSDLKSGDWLAVSATFLQGGRGRPAVNFNEPTGYYNWLNELEPKAVIGYSIFVYQIP